MADTLKMPISPAPPAQSGDSRGEREHFIPLRKLDLVGLLSRELGLEADEARRFQSLVHRLEAAFQLESQQRLDELQRHYSQFEPDADTLAAPCKSRVARHASATEFFRQIALLLERANYRRLPREVIERALAEGGTSGLRLDIDFAIFKRLEVFVRGDAAQTRVRRDWRRGFRRVEQEIPGFQRLVVVFQPRKHKRMDPRVTPESIYLKMFRNISRADLDMVLPGTRVKMSLLDRGRILLPTVSGIGMTLYKLMKGAIVLAAAGMYGLWASAGLIVGLVGYGVKSFFGYLRTKERHRLNLTQNLYYQNLDNNAGVLYRLLGEAREQEFREAILAYALLWQRAPATGWTAEELDRAIEALLYRTTGRDVDFEIDDGIAKLCRLQLVDELPGDRWRAVPLYEAITRLERSVRRQIDPPAATPRKSARPALEPSPAIVPMRRAA